MEHETSQRVSRKVITGDTEFVLSRTFGTETYKGFQTLLSPAIRQTQAVSVPYAPKSFLIGAGQRHLHFSGQSNLRAEESE